MHFAENAVFYAAIPAGDRSPTSARDVAMLGDHVQFRVNRAVLKSRPAVVVTTIRGIPACRHRMGVAGSGAELFHGLPRLNSVQHLPIRK